jgi:hypothetical protein
MKLRSYLPWAALLRCLLRPQAVNTHLSVSIKSNNNRTELVCGACLRGRLHSHLSWSNNQHRDTSKDSKG